MTGHFTFGPWLDATENTVSGNDFIQVQRSDDTRENAEASDPYLASDVFRYGEQVAFFRQVYRTETDQTWRPLKDYTEIKPRKMYLVRAKTDAYTITGTYTTDPYCAWYDFEDKQWCSRWPHHFPPTHFCEIPV